jgi:hypothetical protein
MFHVTLSSSKAKDDEEFPTKYFKVHLELDSGVEMAFTDKRRFARVRLLPEVTFLSLPMQLSAQNFYSI